MTWQTFIRPRRTTAFAAAGASYDRGTPGLSDADRQRNRSKPARSSVADRHGRRQRGDVSRHDEPRVCGGLRLPGPDQAVRRRAGRIGSGPRRRSRRHDGGAGIAQRRLQGSGPGIQSPSGRPQLDAARRRHVHRTRRLQSRPANSRKGFISIRGRGGFPIIIAPSSITAKGSTSRSSRSSSSITMPFCTRRARSAGKPQRIREIKADFQGEVAELLAKATAQGKLDEAVSTEDKEILLQALKSWGALDNNYAYKANLISAEFRGYAKAPGGGLDAEPVAGEPIGLSDILKSRLWRYLQGFALHSFQTTMFQPVGGMDMIGKAFGKELGDLIRYDAKVTRIAAGRRRRHRQLRRCRRSRGRASGESRLVRLHHSALHSQPDPDRRRRAHEGGDRRGALPVGDQDRLAVQAPVLGGGRGDLRRHQLHGFADPADRLSEYGL